MCGEAVQFFPRDVQQAAAYDYSQQQATEGAAPYDDDPDGIPF